MADDTVKIPNMVVTFGNGAEVIFVVDEEAYRVASKQDHPKLTAKVIELSGGKWDEKIANDYLKQFPAVDYFQAIDQVRAADKTLAEAVAFFNEATPA